MSHSGIQVLFSRYSLEEKGRGETIGHPFLPSNLERKSPVGKKEAPEGPKPGQGIFGIWDSGLLASNPGVLISHSEQGVKHKARGKMKGRAVSLGMASPQGLSSLASFLCILTLGFVPFPCLESLWPVSLLS